MADWDSTADQWLETQRRYWDAWMDMARQGMSVGAGGAPKPENAWTDAVEKWWQAVAPATPQPAQNLMEHMVNLGKSYFSMAESLSKGSAVTDPGAVAETWSRMMTEAFTKSASKTFNPFAMPGAMSAGAMPGFMAGAMPGATGGRAGLAFWDLPFDNIARTLSAGLPVPGDFLKAFETQTPAELRAHVDRFLSAPAIGYARESQEQHQAYSRLLLEYQQAANEYNAGFAELGGRSLEAFRKHLDAVTKDGNPVTSVRQVYNLWVDACEEVYAEYAMSDDYAKRYGKMVNALMAAKRQGSILVDEMLEAMNMPTRGDIAAVHRRLHDTRAEVFRLRAKLESQQVGGVAAGVGSSDELVDLRNEVAELRKAVQALSEASASAADATDDDDAASATDQKAGTARKTSTTRRKNP